ncbi:MAG: hypothetical protein ACUVWR_19170, partial [Anaerolineae bacterium]
MSAYGGSSVEGSQAAQLALPMRMRATRPFRRINRYVALRIAGRVSTYALLFVGCLAYGVPLL